MPENNDQQVFFRRRRADRKADARGSRSADPPRKKRPATVSALWRRRCSSPPKAGWTMPSRNWSARPSEGENPVEVSHRPRPSALRTAEMGAKPRAATRKSPSSSPSIAPRTTIWAWCLERQGKFEDAAKAFRRRARRSIPSAGRRSRPRPVPVAARQDRSRRSNASQAGSEGKSRARSGAVRQSGGAASTRASWTKRAISIASCCRPSRIRPSCCVNLIALSALRKEDGKVKEYAERLLKLRPQSPAGSARARVGRARPRRLQRGRAALLATGEGRAGFL